ncbi:sodium channel protein type 7 subunit alpha isoform X1 [Homo sapiens]|uniref:Sodium channel protein type 7 subunit alpha n=4 Tax=Homo sapiens TaxID=9606 RepID=SCN7A_HUMAN|nr:sodium channel protein type 7 subunit alpha [Homo sapiens]XP_006712743.1 sodium channel protein type 7 subunit alpha isoform X1 [Homo sapiens]XP_006712745.1 sodium channel protein type 7 subunit alpha isoform X1 [Homo sapiens]XP_011509917.1 sodium channel protein type 7 subunit alpha isoform X1 [Homo sapiens]XP_016860156.1 sodium channel protein type 7 subunit alpha isoform X1 [Homo sapiens]XP_047301352.1 sodium channel protein type 7 subunit alpha isoform X1 [Homo sapiens]XP_047301353.1 s|eukprot:NP_002967.2 sodium channel protein type 7 subunit alpha [Homo sapiens]
MLASPEPKGLVPFTKESFELIKQHIAKTHNEDHEEEDLKPTPDLEVGKKLPFIYGNLSQGMVSEPLEDVDPYYYKKKNTFIVLNKNRTIFRFNAASILCTLSPFNCIRRTTIKVLVHPFFQLFILISVLIDCVFMSLTNLPKWRPVLENTLLGIYTFEILVKLFARGVWAGSFSFLGDPWNWLDFSVTVFEVIIRYSPLDFIPTLQTARTLRILKIIPLNQGLKSLVGVLIHCLKQLIGVIILTLFFLSIFSLIGMGLFMGNLKHKCFRWPQENENETLHNRTGNPYYIRETENFYYLEGERYALLCGNRTDAGQCPEGYVCVKAGINPDQGFTNFDSFGWALFALFRLMAQDYPEVLYHQILYASGKVYMIFFVVVSFLFSFYMASLFLGILAMAYEEEKQRVGEISKKIEPKFQQTGKELQEGNETDEAKTIQIEMKKRSPISTDTSLDVLEDATLRHKEELEKSKKICPLYWYKFAKTFLIWNCSPCWLKLKEFVHRIIMAPFTDLFLIICIILNVCFLTLEHYPMSKQTNTLLNIGNLVFIGIFTAEMIFKIIAMHPYGYFQVGWNIFDSMIVFHGLIELCLANVAGMALLRLFRMLRIFKLGKYWPTFQILMWSLSNSWVALKDLVLLLFTFIFFSAAFGMKLFGKNYEEFVCHIDKDCQLPRWHMHDFFHSFLNVFRILCGEWVETLWDCMEVAGQSWCIPFYLMVILIGNLLVLYLFLALVSSFSSCKDVTAEENNEAKNLQLAVARIKKGINYVLLKILCKTQNVPKDTMDHVNEVYVKEDISDHTLSELSNTQDFLKDKEKSSGTEKNATENESQSLIPSPSVSETVPIASGESDIENLDNKEIQSKSGDGGSKEKIKQSSSSECSTVDIAISEEEEMFYGGERSKHLKNGCRRGSSLGQISGASKKGKIWQNIRKTCCKIVENNWFKCFIGLVTLLSTGTLAFEDIYMDQRKTIKILLEYADMIFTYIFILEMLLKWMAYGFKAYFSNGWYRLDFVVVIVFCLSLIGKTREELKPLISMKFLRPLRVLSQFERMKVVVRALIKTTLPTLNVFLVCLMIWLIFSIMGVDLFAGRFYECIDPTSGERFPSSEVMNKSRCESLLFNESMLWENAKMNFDNVGNGFLSLLQVATFNGWITIMNSAIDSVAVNIQPHFEVNIYMYCYFINFIIFGVFLPLSMLITVIIDNFNKHKIKLGGSNIFITVKQRKQYRRLKKLMYEDSQRPVPRPLNKLQGFIFDVVTSQAFNVIVMVLICFQAIAMMIDTDVQSLQMSIALYWINSIFVMLYTMECILKLIAFRCFYFTIAWNIFDFMVVIFSITGLCLPMTVGSYLVPPSLVQLILLSRIIHMLRLGKGPKVFHNLMLPLMLSLPALLNIILLIFLVMFIYAVFGMYNFAYVKKEAGINDVSNFETFGNSMLCLFQVAIFAGWDGMLDAIFNSKWSDCDPDKINPGTQVRGDCGNPSVGIFYFVSYILISWLIIVNMYIVVVMEFLNIASKKKNKTLSEDDFRKFFQVWKRFDPDRTQYIDSSKLSDFAAALDPPLFMAKPNKGQLIALDLPMAVGDRIHCLDILLAFTKRVMGQDVRMEKVVSEIESGFLLANPFKITCEPITTTLKRKQEAVSATIIQRAYKNYRLRRNDKNTSDIHMIDGDRDVHATKEGAYFDKAKEKSPIQSQI